MNKVICNLIDVKDSSFQKVNAHMSFGYLEYKLYRHIVYVHVHQLLLRKNNQIR